MADYRTALARVRGLGPARAGTDHFWMQRLTGVSNLFLLVFLFTWPRGVSLDRRDGRRQLIFKDIF